VLFSSHCYCSFFFVAAARANPGSIRFGHSGPATSPHFLGAPLARTADFPMTDIPYRALGSVLNKDSSLG